MDNKDRQALRKLDLFDDLKMLDNTYIANEKHYKSIIGKYITQRNASIGINIVLLVVILILSLNYINIASQPKFKSMIFDKKGSYLGVALSEVRTNDELLIKGALTDYITFLYAAPQDPDTRKYFVRKVASMTSGKYFDDVVSQIMKDNYTKFPIQSITITIQNDPIPTSKNVWQIDWISTIDGKKNVYYKSVITFAVSKDISDIDRMTNPLGLLVTNILTQEKRLPNND